MTCESGLASLLSKMMVLLSRNACLSIFPNVSLSCDFPFMEASDVSDSSGKILMHIDLTEYAGQLQSYLKSSSSRIAVQPQAAMPKYGGH